MIKLALSFIEGLISFSRTEQDPATLDGVGRELIPLELTVVFNDLLLTGQELVEVVFKFPNGKFKGVRWMP